MSIDRDVERQLNRAVRDGMRDVARDYQRMFDALGRRYRGQPVPTVKAALEREWKRVDGGRLTDPDLNEYATAISEGLKITMQVG